MVWLKQFPDGYIPSRMAREFPVSNAARASLTEVSSRAVPWDSADAKPGVYEWESVEEYLLRLPNAKFKWWREIAAPWVFFVPSQGACPSCAGFGLDRARQATLANQIVNGFSEQKLERLNPLVTWSISKGGSVWGGATLQQVLLAGNSHGVWTEEMAGEYDPRGRYSESWRKMDNDARLRQIGFSMIPGEGKLLAERILLCVKKGFGVIFGNNRAVDRFRKDKNGIYAAETTYGGNHATAFGDWIEQNGETYLLWMNSHGNIYEKDDDTPAFGGYMRWDTFVDFCSAGYVDAGVVLVAEAPYDPSVRVTLNIETGGGADV